MLAKVKNASGRIGIFKFTFVYPTVFFSVTIEGKEVDDLVTIFKGFHVRVMRVNWDPEEAIGQFTEYDEEIIRAQSWYPIRDGDIVSTLIW